MEGYQVMLKDNMTTVWSAPNYLYRFSINILKNKTFYLLFYSFNAGNMASVLEIDE
jgi:hypothetical protein